MTSIHSVVLSSDDKLGTGDTRGAIVNYLEIYY